MATTNEKDDMELLRSTLDAHGANPDRWPQGLGDKLPQLLRLQPRAERMLEEERALDNLLGLAPTADTRALVALTDRIVTAAVGRAAEPARGANVVQLRPRRPSVPALPATGMRRGRMGFTWPAAAGVLAASLILGVLAGVSGYVSPTLQQVAAMTADDASDSGEVSGLVSDADDPEGGLL